MRPKCNPPAQIEHPPRIPFLQPLSVPEWLILNLAAIILILGTVHSPAQWQPTSAGRGHGTPAQHAGRRLPDPRYRSPMGVWEIDHVVSMVSRATGRGAAGSVVVSHEVPFARIHGSLDAGVIQINPRAAQGVPPNSWAFVIGHELAHQIHRIGQHGRTTPELEFRADLIGAEYAMKAGFDLVAHIAWTLSRPDGFSPSHGSPHDRANRLGAYFGVPVHAVRAHLHRYQGR